jgi:hypothetical protein
VKDGRRLWQVVALWAEFDALTACGASPGDAGDAALSLARPLRNVHSLYGM